MSIEFTSTSTMRNPNRDGGMMSRLRVSFSWTFARVASCKTMNKNNDIMIIVSCEMLTRIVWKCETP